MNRGSEPEPETEHNVEQPGDESSIPDRECIQVNFDFMSRRSAPDLGPTSDPDNDTRAFECATPRVCAVYHSACTSLHARPA